MLRINYWNLAKLVCAFSLLFSFYNPNHLNAQTSYPTSGTDFMFCIPSRNPLHQYPDGDNLLILSSLYNTQVTLSCPGIAYNQTLNLIQNQPIELVIPNIGAPKTPELAGDTTWHITSKMPISVMLEKSIFKGSGIINVFPTMACGTKYRVIGFRNNERNPAIRDPSNVVAITALCDTTRVRIVSTDTSSTGKLLPKKPLIVDLNKGQSYFFRTADVLDFNAFTQQHGDFSGTLIESLDPRKKIAVTITDFDDVGPESAADRMYEMLAPYKMADTLFFDFTSKINRASRYRVLATQDSTRIWVNHQFKTILNVDTFYQFNDSNQIKLQSDKPVVLYRFIYSTTFPVDKWGDPELLRVEPANTGITESVVLPRQRGSIVLEPTKTKHYLQLICKKGDEKSLHLNGVLQAQKFKPFAIDNNWLYADFEVDTNIQRIKSDKPFKGFYGISVPHGSLAHNLTGASAFDNFYEPPQKIEVKNCIFPYELKAPIYADSVLWFNGQKTPKITVNDTGTYWVKQVMLADCGTPIFRTDTLKVTIGNIDYSKKHGPSVCLVDTTSSAILGEFNSIVWNDGNLQSSRNIKPNTWYPFELQLGKCKATDSVFVSALPDPNVNPKTMSYSCGDMNQEFDLNAYGAKRSDSTQLLPSNKFSYVSKNRYKTQSNVSFTAYLNTTNYHGCVKSDTLHFEVEPKPDSLEIESNYSCEDQALYLSVTNPQKANNLNWLLGGKNYSGSSIELDGLHNSKELTGILKYTYGQNCKAEQTINLGDSPVLNSDKLSNVFTPNGDGYNDEFHPIINELDRPCTSFEVFNRWGQLVFSSSNGKTWNGDLNDKNSLPGVYFYTLKAFGQEIKGNVTLIR